MLPVTATQKALVIIAAVLPLVMDIMDRTIVNVVMPYMQGSLGADPDQITWVSTMYMVASAVVMPMTGFLVARVGLRRLLLLAIAGFTLASVMCGASTSLTEMIVFRVLQGICGAVLVPLSQTVMITHFSVEERPRVMGFWVLGIMVAPVLGPTLGGYINDWFNWRFVFYVNVPLGALAFLLTLEAIRDNETRKVSTDWLGIVLVVLGLGSLQLFLDRGQQMDWFASGWIILLALTSLFALVWLVGRGWNKKDGIVNMRLFIDRNFGVSCIILASISLGLYAYVTALPMMLEDLFGYDSHHTGLLMLPQALAATVVMVSGNFLAQRMSPAILVFLGGIAAFTAAWIMTTLSLEADAGHFIVCGILMGAGTGLVFMPLSVLAYETLPRNEAPEATGLFNLVRTMASSIGVSIMGTLLARLTQENWHSLAGYINPFSEPLQRWLSSQGTASLDAEHAQILGNQIHQQGMFLAFLDIYYLVAIGFLVSMPLLVLLRRKR